MKKSIIRCLVITNALLFSSAAISDQLDSSKKIICSATDIFECTPDGGCVEVKAVEINAPEFFKIDFKNNLIEPIPKNEGQNVKILSSKIENNHLVMQGMEAEEKVAHSNIGWSLTISEDVGKMSLAASGENVGFMMLGNCTNL